MARYAKDCRWWNRIPQEHYENIGNNIDPSILIKNVEKLIDVKVKEVNQ